MKYEVKNKQWFADFENRNYDFLYYVESGHVYYDLVVLEKGNKYNAIPAPIFSKKYMGLKIDGSEINLGQYERSDIQSYLYEHTDFFKSISDEKFYEMKEEARIREEDKKILNSLTDEEKEILKTVENNGYVLDKTENQYGEKVIMTEITGSIEEGFFLYNVTCLSTSWLGLGTCQCVNHDYFSITPISFKDVIEIVQQDMKNKQDERIKEEEYISSLDEDDRKLLEEIEENGLELETAENQFGEMITTKSITPSKDGMKLVYLNCWSANSVGMGICNCVNHPTWKSKKLSAKEILEIAKEYLTKQKN